MYGLTTWLLGAVAVTVAATVQAIAGFGLALVVVPFLMLMFDPKMAVGITIVVSVCSLSILLLKVRDDAQWSMVKTLFWGALLGLPIGVTILHVFKIQILKVFINAIIIILSILLTFEVNFKINGNSKKWQFGAGSISGALSSSLGIPGPPIVLFLSNLDLSKEKFRATLVAYFILIDLFSYIALFVTNTLPPRTFLIAITFIPFTFLGIFMGNKIFNKIPADKFKRLVIILLIVVETYSIVTSIKYL